jgi:hypothetical protein
MKTQLANLLSHVSKTEMIELAATIKETLAPSSTSRKIFSAAELWNIQRNRNVLQRRRFSY